MRRFAGRVAVLTGAASGIGRAMAGRFAAEGMRVVLADVERPALDRAVAELRGAGAAVLGVPTDVSRAQDVQALADATIGEFGAVHVLCDNAGVGIGSDFAKIPLAAWEWVLGVDLWGVIHGCRAFLEPGDNGTGLPPGAQRRRRQGNHQPFRMFSVVIFRWLAGRGGA